MQIKEEQSGKSSVRHLGRESCPHVETLFSDASSCSAFSAKEFHCTRVQSKKRAYPVGAHRPRAKTARPPVGGPVRIIPMGSCWRPGGASGTSAPLHHPRRARRRQALQALEERISRSEFSSEPLLCAG